MNTELDPLPEIIRDPAETGYVVNEEASRLLGSSAHGAEVVVDDDDRRWIRKSDYTKPAKAYNEIAMIEAFQREGIPTLPPTPNMSPFVEALDENPKNVRVYIPQISGLRSLTGLNWEVFAGSEEEEGLNQTVDSVIGLVAKMHRRHFIHGDFQIKNLGVLKSSKLIVYDLEAAKDITKLNVEDRTNLRVQDLVTLFKSLRINGFYKYHKPSALESEVSDRLQVYIDKIGDDQSLEIASTAGDEFFKWATDEVAVVRSISRFMSRN